MTAVVLFFGVDTSVDFNAVQVTFSVQLTVLYLKTVARLISIWLRFCEVFGTGPRFLI